MELRFIPDPPSLWPGYTGLLWLFYKISIFISTPFVITAAVTSMNQGSRAAVNKRVACQTFIVRLAHLYPDPVNAGGALGVPAVSVWWLDKVPGKICLSGRR